MKNFLQNNANFNVPYYTFQLKIGTKLASGLVGYYSLSLQVIKNFITFQTFIQY